MSDSDGECARSPAAFEGDSDSPSSSPSSSSLPSSREILRPDRGGGGVPSKKPPPSPSSSSSSDDDSDGYQRPQTPVGAPFYLHTNRFSEVDLAYLPEYVPSPRGKNVRCGDEADDARVSQLVDAMGLRRAFPPRFDPEESVLSTARSVVSDLELSHLRKAHYVGKFPSYIQLRLPGVNERACSLEDDQGWIPFNVDHIKDGLRYPFPQLLEDVLNHFSLAATQLSPNAIADILAFSVWCRRCLVPESVPLFLQYFGCVQVAKEPGYYFFRRKQSADHLFAGGVSKWEDWKRHYCFIRSGRLGKPINFPSKWKFLAPKLNKAARTNELSRYIKRLRHPNLPLDATVLCSPEVLAYLGVTPFNLSPGKLTTHELLYLCKFSLASQC